MGLKEVSEKELLNLISQKDYNGLIDAIDSIGVDAMDNTMAEIICNLIVEQNRNLRHCISQKLVLSNNENIPGFLIKYISSPDISVRNLAGEIMLRIGKKSVNYLLDGLEGADADDTKFIIDILGLIGEAEATDKIIDVLRVSSNENVVLACIEALGNLQSLESVNELLNYYDVNELYKPTIVEALGKSNSQESLEFLLNKFHKEDDLVKYSIIESLGTLGNENTFFFLLSELNETSPNLIPIIIYSIYQLKLKYNYDIPFDERTKNLILNTFYESDAEYKKAAAYLLAAFDDKEIIQSCLNIYGEDYEIDEILKDKFFENPETVLCKIPSVIEDEPSNLFSLLQLVRELSEFNLSINLIDKRNLVNSISKCLDHSDEEVRKSSMEILFQLDCEYAFVFTDKMIEDISIWNKLRLLEILDNFDHPEIINCLEKLSKDPDEMVQSSAIASLLNRTSTKNLQ